MDRAAIEVHHPNAVKPQTLSEIVARAQVILAAAAEWNGPSKADTIKALNDLLRGPEANASLAAAEREVQS